MIVSQDISDVDPRIVFRREEEFPLVIYRLEEGERIEPGDSRVCGWNTYNSIPSDWIPCYKVVGESEDFTTVTVQETGQVFERGEHPQKQVCLIDGEEFWLYRYTPKNNGIPSLYMEDLYPLVDV